MSDAGHFPGKAEEEFPVEEAPKEEAPKEEAPKEEAPKDAPEPGDEVPKEEPPKEEEAPKDEPTEPEPIKNKRSIYEDLKDERKERKGAEARVKELEEENARLKSDSPPPPAPPPGDELDAFAAEQGVDRKTIERLADIVAKKVPSSDLTKTERQQLAELKSWQEGKMKEEARAAEDREIRVQSTSVKDELQIHDDAELAKVMDEIVKLAHTERFHDKEVGYIVWANRDALSKLVSPKKTSFESGSEAAPGAEAKEVEYSGKMTPAAAQKAVESSYAKSNLEIRRG